MEQMEESKVVGRSQETQQKDQSNNTNSLAQSAVLGHCFQTLLLVEFHFLGGDLRSDGILVEANGDRIKESTDGNLRHIGIGHLQTFESKVSRKLALDRVLFDNFVNRHVVVDDGHNVTSVDVIGVSNEVQLFTRHGTASLSLEFVNFFPFSQSDGNDYKFDSTGMH